MHIFKYGNKSSRDFDVVISGQDTWKKPAPRVERLSVPGRNGDIVTFDGSYENVDIPYHCGIQRHFDLKYTSLMNYLMSHPGYNRLEDSYHPNVFRLGALIASDDPTLGTLNRSGEFDLTFNCKPQSFLKSGEIKKEFTAAGTIYNPTLYTSKPLLRVYGTGTFTIGSDIVTITQANGYTDFDCDVEDAYKDDASHNCNSFVQFSGDHFPTIPPGEQGVSLGSGITKIEIIPRWWVL